MKTFVKYVLQSLMGFRRYLYTFAIFKIRTLQNDKKENDFFYFLSLLKPGSTVLDIGANIGVMTYHLSRSHNNIKVIAFEPVLENIAVIKQVLSKFSITNVTLLETALGSHSGELKMVMPSKGKVRFHGLSHVVNPDEPVNGTFYTVPVKKLDDVPQVSEVKSISGIKIDVENFEYEVLLGGASTIAVHRPVIYLELWDNDNRTKCFDLARKLNYKIMIRDGAGLQEFDPNRHVKQNFFFVP